MIFASPILPGAGLRSATLILCLLVGWACAAKKPVFVSQTSAALTQKTLPKATIILVGDTGKPGPYLDAVRKAIANEKKDMILALGDLIYPWAPKCRDGKLQGEERKTMELHVKKALEGLGAPVLLALGNHDVGLKLGRYPLREACFLALAAENEELVFPALTYKADLGVALVSVINTNALDDEMGATVAKDFQAFPGWTILAGHHVLRTYHDKESENLVLPWLRKHKIKPSIYANGHAHFLQFGVYEDIPAATSGSGSKLRSRPACPPNCGEGQLWGVSEVGYAVLNLTPEKMTLVFKDSSGKALWDWAKTRPAPGTQE